MGDNDTASISLDFNGHTLEMVGKSRIVLNSGDALTITDSAQGAGKGALQGVDRKDREVIEHNGGILINGTAIFGDTDKISLGTSVELDVTKALLDTMVADTRRMILI